MYPWLECLIVAAVAICVGTGVFLAAAMVLILRAGWSVAVTRSLPLPAKAQSQLREKLSALHLVEAPEGVKCEP